MRLRRRVRQSDVERHELRLITHQPLYRAACEGDVALMRLEQVGAEIEHVLRVLDVVEAPVALPDVAEMGGTVVR